MGARPPKPTNTLIANLTRNLLVSRLKYLNSLMDGPGRNLDKDCGYPENPTIQLYRQYYDREGLATRVVGVYPDECWCIYPFLYESSKESITTPFEQAWKDLNDRIDVWSYLHRVDKLSGIGSFGIILIGVNDGKTLDQPIANLDENGEPAAQDQLKLLFLRVFSEDLVDVHSVQASTASPRYGLPLFYNIQFGQPVANGKAETQTVKVHWSRVIHVADNLESSEVYGVPRMQQCLNRLFDLRKTLGGSAEMLWRGGFPGYFFEALPEVTDESELDFESVKEQFQSYVNGLQRYMALQGMTAKSLAPQVANPVPQFEIQIQALCATIGVPVPVFLGQMEGHMAGQSNTGMWNRRLGKRQRDHVNPRLIRPLVDRFIAFRILPKPKQYVIDWRDLNSVTDKDRADISLKKAQAILQYVTSGAESLMAPLEFLTLILEMPKEMAESVIEAANANQTQMTEDVWNKQAIAAQAAATETNQTGSNGQRNGLGSSVQ